MLIRNLHETLNQQLILANVSKEDIVIVKRFLIFILNSYTIPPPTLQFMSSGGIYLFWIHDYKKLTFAFHNNQIQYLKSELDTKYIKSGDVKEFGDFEHLWKWFNS